MPEIVGELIVRDVDYEHGGIFIASENLEDWIREHCEKLHYMPADSVPNDDGPLDGISGGYPLSLYGRYRLRLERVG